MLMPMLPALAGSAAIAFQTAFLKSLSSTQSVGASNITLVQKVFAGAFNGLTGTHLKIVVGPPLTGSMVVTAARVGFPDGSPTATINFDGNQVPLTWDGGQAGGTFSQSLAPVPDEIPFAVPDLNKALLFTFNVSLGGTYRQRGSNGANYSFFKKVGVSQATDTTRTGYTQTAQGLLVVSQLLIGSGS